MQRALGGRVTRALLVGLAVVLLGSAVEARGARRALLVGVWAYERGGGDTAWKNLGSRADVAALRCVLIDRLGFADADVVVRTDPAHTTHRAIIDAFRTVLVDPAGPDDEIFFHFSGHGAQVPDAREIDGLAETLVPSDYVSLTDGSNDIRDTEIRALLEALAAKGVTRVTLSFDCCHAGSVTRGGRRVGRTAEPSATDVRAVPQSDVASRLARDAAARRFVVLSACRPDEQAAQRYDAQQQVVGVFSYALAGALARATPATTWRDVYEIVREALAAESQTPQIAGPLDRLVFGGSAPSPLPYIAVRGDVGALMLEAGRLQGVDIGTVVDIYAPGTRDLARAAPLATAEVVQAGLATSTLRVEGASVGALTGGRARIRRQVLPARHLRVGVVALRSTPNGEAMARALGDVPGVTLETAGDCPIAATHVDGAWRLVRDDGGLLAVVPEGPQAAEALQAAVLVEARRRWVAGLSNDSPDALSVRMRLVRVEPLLVEGRPAGVKRVIGPLAAGAKAQAGEWVRVEVWNAGYQRAWLTLLNVTSEGGVSQLWPPPHRAREEERMENSVDEQWVPLPDLLVRLTPTRGKETFKLIATDRPVQLGPALDPVTAREARRDRVTHPLVRGFLDATLGLRSGREAIEPAAWGTASVTIEVRARDVTPGKRRKDSP